MPIKENKRNHDFEWEFDTETSNQTPVNVPLRYHQTEEYGPTISMLDENNNVGYSFPADMFIDVSEEIKRIESFHGNKTKYTKHTSMPSIGMPVIKDNTGMFKTGSSQNSPENENYSLDKYSSDDSHGIIDNEIHVPKNGFESFIAETNNNKENFNKKESEVKREDIIAERGRTKEEWEAKKAENKEKSAKKSIKRSENKD